MKETTERQPAPSTLQGQREQIPSMNQKAVLTCQYLDYRIYALCVCGEYLLSISILVYGILLQHPELIDITDIFIVYAIQANSPTI